MVDEDILEFTIAHRRKYSIEHLWYQEKDDKVTVGLSDFLAKDIGEVLRVILPHAEDEFDEDDEMFSIWTADEKLSFRAPFSGVVSEVNGEVEISPDLVNESAYDLGWLIIIDPHHLDMEIFLEPDEYVEALAEL
jgi:glycine cleavage system H protein